MVRIDYGTLNENANEKEYSREEYYNRLSTLLMSSVKWEKLPETVDERFLELSLFTDGRGMV